MNTGTCMPDPHWTAYVTALTLPIIAAIAAWIAWRQSDIAKNKLKLDLFDRRMDIYLAAQDLANRGRSARVPTDELIEIVNKTHQAKWLFSFAISLFFRKEIVDRVIDLQDLIAELDEAKGDERTANVHRQRELREELAKKLGALEAMMEPYLRIEA